LDKQRGLILLVILHPSNFPNLVVILIFQCTFICSQHISISLLMIFYAPTFFLTFPYFLCPYLEWHVIWDGWSNTLKWFLIFCAPTFFTFPYLLCSYLEWHVIWDRWSNTLSVPNISLSQFSWFSMYPTFFYFSLIFMCLHPLW
jgi:hypothetical protein